MTGRDGVGPGVGVGTLNESFDTSKGTPTLWHPQTPAPVSLARLPHDILTSENVTCLPSQGCEHEKCFVHQTQLGITGLNTCEIRH